MLQDGSFNKDIASAYEQEQPHQHIPHPPIFLSFSAVPGSGKTTLAKRLARDLRTQYVNHDDIRDLIRKRGIDSEELCMPPISRIVINHMITYDKNKFVILDVSIDRRWDIFYDHVKELNALPIVIRLNPPINVIRERLRIRDDNNGAILNQLNRFKDEFDNCCQHVEADITVSKKYDYGQVLEAVRGKISETYHAQGSEEIR